jgi:hypothetical protein
MLLDTQLSDTVGKNVIKNLAFFRFVCKARAISPQCIIYLPFCRVTTSSVTLIPTTTFW